ncbi:MAG: flagellar basal body rod C-terminal domain-containing protein [Micavibrio sp.]|nr:flagellar basal body rod C-terminal domain-containing protein [Micavibrio sp.]
MADALSIALSGLQAQQTRLAATASNIANASTTGRVPGASSSAPASASSSTAPAVYSTVTVDFTSLESGGVKANVTANPNGYELAYDPSASYANSDGYVAAPAVDLAQESVNLIETRTAYKANISVIKTQDEMLGELLDTIA